MKTLLYILLVLTLGTVSCKRKRSNMSPSYSRQITKQNAQLNTIDSAKLLLEPRALQEVLLKDSIDLEAVQDHINKGTDLDMIVPYEYSYTSGPFRRGSFLNTLLSTRKDVKLSLTALQSTIFGERYNWEEAMMMLLEAGAEPDFYQAGQKSCLDMALGEQMPQAVWDTLMHYGADPKKVNLAMARKNIDAIRYFLDLGADPQTIAINYFLPDPVFTRYRNKNMKLLDEILTYDVPIHDVHPTAIYLNGHFDSEVLDKLLAKGLDFNRKIFDLREEYWLDWAVNRMRRDDFILYLLDHGAYRVRDKAQTLEMAEHRGCDEELIERLDATIK